MGKKTKISTIFDEVMIRAPGATVALVELETFATLREFFVDSGAWLVEAPPVSIKAYQPDYYLDPQPDGDVLYIYSMAYPTGDRYKFLTVSQQQTVRGRVFAPSAIPITYHGYVDEPGKFTLSPTVTVDAKKALIPYVVLTLKDSACDGNKEDIPSWMLRYWKDIWIDGILGRMMSQPNKPYSNPAQAQYHGRRFRTGIARARDMARRQFGTAETDFKFPRWA